jgi:DNA polymerase-3 subunit gamma/tau
MESNFIVSARKYRPQNFESVVGQQSITTTLKNAIKSNQLAHAYLFCGPRGVGKTTCARIFAKTINCQNLTDDVEACNECQSCVAFNTNRSMNIHELDAASNNSVEDIRKLIDQVRVPPQIGKYSVYIIDEVHMLSTAAFNAFLKTLEEPPEHAIFILATTEKHKILPTILSRCQIFDFNRIEINDIVNHLIKISEKENITADVDALTIIAQKADGALRDALSFYDQIASFSDKHITYEKVIQSLNVLDYEYYFKLTDAFLNANYIDALLIFDDILKHGFDSHNFIVGLSSHFRDLLVVKDPQTIQLLQLGHNIKEKYLEQAKKTSVQFLLKGIEIISKTDIEHKLSKNKRLHVELMLLQLSQITGKLNQKFVQNNTQKQTNTPAQKQIINNTQTTEKNTQNKNTEIKTKKSENTEQSNIQQTETKETENKKTIITKTKLPSVTSLLNSDEQEEQTQQKKENNKSQDKEIYTGKEKVNLEQVKEQWQIFGKQFKQKSPRLYSIFSEYQIQLENQTIKLELSNQDQKEKIEKIKIDILKTLNKTLNTDLSLEIKLSKKPIKSKKPYTQEEKYQFLKQKNPQLDILKKQFNLFND